MLPLLALIPGIFDLLEKVAIPVVESMKPQLSTGILGSILSGKGADGILEILEGALGKLEDTKRIQLQSELQTLLAQIDLEKTEVNNSKPWYKVPHEVAEMFADIYLATGFLVGIAHILLFVFNIVIPFAGYDSITVGIALSFSGLIKAYKTLQD